MKSSLRGALTRERPLVLGALVLAVLCILPTLGVGISAQTPLPPTVDNPIYRLTVFATVPGASGVATVPSHLRTDFGNDVYVSTVSSGADAVHRFSPTGTPVLPAYTLPDSESDPVALEFPSEDEGFGSRLYISARNRDNVASALCGGAIMTMNSAGNFTDFTSLTSSVSCGTSQSVTAVGFPIGMAFASTDVSLLRLYVTSTGLAGEDRLLQVDSTGAVTHMADGLTGGLTFDVDILWGGGFGGALYAAEANGAWEIRSVATTGDPDHPFANTSTPVVTLSGAPVALKFTNGGIFGTGLFVGLNNGEIYRLSLNEGVFEFTRIARGFSSFSVDSIEFGSDGETMYITDPAAGRVYVIKGGTDSDNDGIGDLSDNCRTTMNSDQADLDLDGEGDACDPDDDGDTVDDGTDNCRLNANTDQTNSDGDAQGDACDPDDDDDLRDDNDDNCPTVPNADQTDTDGNGVGDVCDDADGDGILNDNDNCPVNPNADQVDSDGDLQGDVCDLDNDSDSVLDEFDNCPLTPNADQGNADGDSQGNACDTDDDNDGVPDTSDACPLVAGSSANGCPASSFEPLIDAVEALALQPAGLKNSLLAKLRAAEAAAARGRSNAAENLLRAFIHEVTAMKKTGKLPPATADALIAQAQAVINGLP